jgi:Uncharacterized protein conserved in bacteria (DUF2330)
MHRRSIASGIAVSAWVLTFAHARDAAACGGCFTPPRPPSQVASDITDERMLLTVSQKQTTLYDQIQYVGSPQSFAWVLPIHGTVTVGLSADVLFESIDALTATKVNPPPSSCPTPPSCGGGGAGGCMGSASSAAGFSDSSGSGGGEDHVVITKQENVGPYATVQLHATDAGSLNAWLAANGFEIPADVTPVIDQYVGEGFDFLAMKLLPNEGVQSMRPIRVSSPGMSLSLPLRMAAIGTGATVGITIWVVSDGRYEPQNFPFYHLEDGALVWDWVASASNYTTLRTQKEASLANAGWEIESSINLNQSVVTNVILAGGQIFGGGGLSTVPSDPNADYLPILGTPVAADSDAGTGGEGGAGAEAGQPVADAQGGPDADADAGVEASAASAVDAEAGAGGEGGASVLETAAQVRDEDILALFAGLAGPNVRVTRIRGDMAHAAMTVDLFLRASSDQSEVSNVRSATKSVNETCPIYKGCQIVGNGTPGQSAASIGKSGCAASAQTVAGVSTGSGALAGLVGLLLARNLRARRRPRSPSRRHLPR